MMGGREVGTQGVQTGVVTPDIGTERGCRHVGQHYYWEPLKLTPKRKKPGRRVVADALDREQIVWGELEPVAPRAYQEEEQGRGGVTGQTNTLEVLGEDS
eukprot:11718447-Ditylum_brightwellii.AAC.1